MGCVPRLGRIGWEWRFGGSPFPHFDSTAALTSGPSPWGDGRIKQY